MKLILHLLLSSLLFSSCAYAIDTPFENHQDLNKKVYAYLSATLDAQEADYQIEIQNIDSRLKLKKCPSNIEIKSTLAHIKPGKNTLIMQCVGSTPWRVFMTARVKLFSYAVVSKHPLNKGHLIKESDLKLEKIQLTQLRSSHLSDIKQATNQVLKKRINRHEVVSVNNLSKPIIIKKGETITIVAKNNGFQISMKGVALMAGSKGDKIKVKNIKTKKVIQGIVFDAQTVKVKL
jgi:flagellar basal body P-ring formation protein FlgA